MAMPYDMEDIQNSAPGQPNAAQTAKLATPTSRNDTQSVTKRYFSLSGSGAHISSKALMCPSAILGKIN